MDRVPECAGERDVLTEFAESELRSSEGFAAEFDVPVEWVEYWLALAELKRRHHAKGCACD